MPNLWQKAELKAASEWEGLLNIGYLSSCIHLSHHNFILFIHLENYETRSMLCKFLFLKRWFCSVKASFFIFRVSSVKNLVKNDDGISGFDSFYWVGYCEKSTF